MNVLNLIFILTLIFLIIIFLLCFLIKKYNAKNHENRKINKKIIILLVLIYAIIISIIFVNDIKEKKKEDEIYHTSANENATYYEKNGCLLFYPDDLDVLEYLIPLCDNPDRYDYQLINYGDIKVLEYDNFSLSLYNNKPFKDLNNLNDETKKIISDYLRYEYKKSEKDEAYTLDFLEESYYTMLDLSDLTINIKDDNMKIYFPKYDVSTDIELGIMQKYSDINFNVAEKEYSRKHYISKNRKALCFSFDDGPYIKTSSIIVDELYKYDSTATFYVVGSRLGENNIAFIKESILKGNEYGSHSYSHASLENMSEENAKEEIYEPYNVLKENLNYQMKTYRPPYGNRKLIDVDLIKVLWNSDSLDWKFRLNRGSDEAIELIKEQVINYTNENDVVLFHDIYETSVKAASELLKYYIDEGYQIMSVSELIDYLELTDIRSFSGK